MIHDKIPDCEKSGSYCYQKRIWLLFVQDIAVTEISTDRLIIPRECIFHSA